MGALRNTEIGVSRFPRVHFNESFSIQVFFSGNENFYLHQIVDDKEQRMQISENPLDGVQPEVKITLNMSLDEMLSMPEVFIDSENIRVIKSPRCDETKALLLLNSLVTSL